MNAAIKPDVIDVICCVFADGTTFWTDEGEAGARKAIAAWKSTRSPERTQELADADVTNGMVIVRMLRKDYIAIGATNNPITMAYMGLWDQA